MGIIAIQPPDLSGRLPDLLRAPWYIQHMGWYCALSGIGAIYPQFLRLQGAANHPLVKASETCQQSDAAFCALQDHLEAVEGSVDGTSAQSCQDLTPGVTVSSEQKKGECWFFGGRELLIWTPSFLTERRKKKNRSRLRAAVPDCTGGTGAVFKQQLFCYLPEKHQQMDFAFSAVIFPVTLDVGIQAEIYRASLSCAEKWVKKPKRSRQNLLTGKRRAKR